MSPVVRGKRGPYPRRVTKRATYADIEALPEHLVGELIEGELFVSPRPASLHTLAGSNLGGQLNPFGQRTPPGGRGGWWILDEPELHLGRNVVVPDLAAWRKERMPEYPDAPFFTLAPDWVCEIASPSTSRVDRLKKLPLYGREGVGHAWIIDPPLRTLEILRWHDGHWVIVSTHGDDERVRAEPFEALELELAGLWPPPPQG